MKSILLMVFIVLSTDIMAAKLIAPDKESLTVSDKVLIRLIECEELNEMQVRLDQELQIVDFMQSQYAGEYFAWLNVEGEAQQRDFEISYTCQGEQQTRSGTIAKVDPDVVVNKVLDRYLRIHPQWTWLWNWGPAVFNYSLLEFANVADDNVRLLTLAKNFQKKHKGTWLPFIVADFYAGALPGYNLSKDFGDKSGDDNLRRVIDLLKNSPRNAIGSLNHYGNTDFLNRFVPASIWLDSLMMWGILAFEYGLYENDVELLDFALDQVRIFKDYLQDEESGLFYHAYDITKGTLYPDDNAFWLRGNGWVAYALATILAQLPQADLRYQAIAEVFKKQAATLLETIDGTGFWDTLVLDGDGYLESSGSALVATSFLKAYRIGLLDEKYRVAAEETLAAISSHLIERRGGYTVEMISKGTNPGNSDYYRNVSLDRNLNYGVGAYFLLLTEYKKLTTKLID